MNTQSATAYLKLSLLSTAIISSLALTACGDSDNDSSKSAPEKQEQSITFTAPAAMAVGESSELNATATSELAITYKATTPEVCTIDEAMVKAIAKGDCKITASQEGNAGFKPADDVMVSIPVVSATLEVSAENLSANQAGTITLAGKPVGEGISAMLGDNELAVTVSDDYTANIPVTAAHLTMAGDIPLVIKKGEETLYEQVISVALPDATGDAYTIKQTGITTCGNATDNSLDCSDETALGDYYQTNQDGEVQAGVDMAYTKVAYQAERDGDKVMEYCVYDNVSGLLWEQKTDDDGLRDKDWKYTWYDSNSATNGGLTGAEAPNVKDTSSDTCNLAVSGIGKCNMEAYIAKLNEIKYCGYEDWRMPTDIELVGIKDFGKTTPPFTSELFNVAIYEGTDLTEQELEATYMTSASIPVRPGYPFGYTPVVSFSAKNFPAPYAFKPTQYAAYPYNILAVRSPE